MICGNSYASSSSESDEDVPIASLKPSRRREIEELSDDQDNIPLAVLDRKAMHSILQLQSSHDEDTNKDEDQEKGEEEGGEKGGDGDGSGGGGAGSHHHFRRSGEDPRGVARG